MVAPRDVRVLTKKGGWGAGPLTLPGGIGYQYTYLLTYPGISHHSTSAKTILEALDHLGLLAY